MSPAVHSLSVGYRDSLNTPKVLKVALLLLLSLAAHSFFFGSVELIAFGIGSLTMLLPPVLLRWLRNYKPNMSSAKYSKIFNAVLVIEFGILGLAFLLSRHLYSLKFGYRNSHSITQHRNNHSIAQRRNNYAITQPVVMGIVLLVLLLSLVSLSRLRNSKTNMPSGIISSVALAPPLSTGLKYGHNRTVLLGRIRQMLVAFYYWGVSNGPVREPPAWRLNYKIGSGAYGTVFLENVQTCNMKSPELWAVKRIPRAFPNFTFKRYQVEIRNLEALARHEWFVKFNSTYEDTHYMYIAMEYIPMGDMSASFADDYWWSESDTKVVIKQLLHGLAVMHKAGVTHRDLKPENIFLYFPEDQTHVLRVKIGDFGTSKRVPHSNASTYLKTTTGTQGYMAPEVHDTSEPKTNKVDIWSLGCVMYRMLIGNLLFNDPLEVLKYALTAPSRLLPLDNTEFSTSCVFFLWEVLQPIPEHRPSAEDCQENPWITNETPGSEYSIREDLYARLSKINHRAPNMHSFRDMVANRAASSSSVLLAAIRKS